MKLRFIGNGTFSARGARRDEWWKFSSTGQVLDVPEDTAEMFLRDHPGQFAAEGDAHTASSGTSEVAEDEVTFPDAGSAGAEADEE